MAILNLFQFVKDFQSFPAGQTIFTQDETGEEAYVVIEGMLDVFYNDRLLETVGPGGLVGEMALIDHQTRSATVIAKSDCKLVPINQTRFTFMVQETPHFALEVMRIMADRLRRELSRDAKTGQSAPTIEPAAENGVKQ
jgi:CRP/FNR family cyclic AMP-dependent transcriptional regulator